MATFQKMMAIGNVTRDIELRYLQTGTAVADFPIAVNRNWKAENGEKREETTFFDCVAFGRTAEIASEYLRKGSPVFVEGHFRNESWTDKETGKKRSKLVLVIENLQLISRKSAEQNRNPSRPVVAEPTPQPVATQAKQTPDSYAEPDIPF
jgi:single-strand DNA-binding protein